MASIGTPTVTGEKKFYCYLYSSYRQRWNLSGYILERSVNSGTYTQIYKGSK